MAPAFTERKLRLAAKLKDARKREKLSQERAAHMVGTSRRHWIRWESGETEPNPAYLDRIAEVLHEDLSEFAVDDDEEAASMPTHHELLEALRPLADLFNRTEKVA